MDIIKSYNLNGKTALITGASGKLGEQFARTLSTRGARVILTGRNLDKLKTLKCNLKNSRAIQLDIADKRSIGECFSTLEKSGEKIDICINNAAILKPTPVFKLNLNNNDFENVIQTNVIGTWHVLQHTVNHMKNKKIRGSIINISSAGADKVSRANVSGYYASKAAILRLTQNLVHELSPHNIRINTILPGTVLTAMTESRFKSKEDIEEANSKIPLQRLGQAEDLDGIILYLASNEASKYVTGSSFTIDGGMSC